MKALKIVLLLLVVVLLVVGAGAWWLSRNVDGVVSEAVTEAGRELTGTRVTVESVDVDVVRGQATLQGLRIPNPPGYSQQPALLLGSIDVDIRLSSIREDVLVIEQVTVSDPEVSFEMNADGVSNISVLERNIAQASPDSTDSGNEQRLIIEQVDFRGGTITAIAAQRPGKELVFDFPSASFSDLGSPDGASASQIGDQIAIALMDRIMAAAQRAGVDSLLERQKEKAIEKFQDLLKEKVDELKGEDIGGGG
ncbi:MAG: hypothetical protein HKN58_01530 [Xanthomonadales bacterium]|nr:hypothetical protein [Xanthomonadales bacterium]